MVRNIKRFTNPYLLLSFIALCFASCSTPIKDVTYMYGIQTGTVYENNPIPSEYKIKTNDQLFIQVISDDPLNAAFLNITNTQSGSTTMGTALELVTYLVDNEGYIVYPKLGRIKVIDLTADEVRNIVQGKVDLYLESASVFVRLVNRNVTVLGEVYAPGQLPMAKNQLSIFEALGAAGDITDYGNRKNVKLLRDLPEGRVVAELDLTDPNIIFSPYYYVLPHDIIYVEHSTKVYGAKNMPYAAPLSITASIVSIVL
ncbi:MAG: polysaccharide biosynthesis/export family protein, partial [Prolixibacteraceae bacterium]|nr:polysaccharide biosynthesis/export family protein [Prolixibacteraceae bacterium]